MALGCCIVSYSKRRTFEQCSSLHTHPSAQAVAMLGTAGVVEKGILPEIAHRQDSYRVTTRADMG